VAKPLAYAVPKALGELKPGVRVRVPVGRRRLVGVVTGLSREAPRGFEVRQVAEVLDVEPAVGSDLLALARFVADYYLAPIGDAVRILLPGGLPPWGDRRVSLTDAGAVAPPREPLEERLKELLLERPRRRLGELQSELGDPGLGRLVGELRRQGRLVVEDPGRRGGRYVQAVELPSGDREEQLRRCGRSPLGRAVVAYLDALGRPATTREVAAAVGCGKGVVQRLVSLGILRRFTQPQRLSLARHRLSGAPAAFLGDRPVSEIVLRRDQEAAVAALEAAVSSGDFQPHLLTGTTGSGKTEVYLRAADKALSLGRSVILLVPEIALVPALAHHVRRRYGRELAILHSNLSSAERVQEWERLKSGEARVVLGPRSALVAPVRNLGLVVVDEEHEGAYKQDRSPRYNGRDLALWRARDHLAAAVLVSATPSLESRHNVERGKLRPLRLLARSGAGMPEGILVDLRREEAVRRPGEVHYSARLKAEIAATLEAGEQVILLRNRRGYAPTYLCRACGEDFRCEDCGLTMTLHRRFTSLLCHYCGHERPAPEVCPECGEEALEPIGAGTERVEEDFRRLFPDVPVDVLDADASRRTGGAAAILERFNNGRTRVLIGTQMVAKGHDFHRVTLAAVLSADTYLGFPDFRAVEKTYALLTQLAGRSGRGERPGRVVIQTFLPRHYAIQAALTGDDEIFAREEMRFRRTFHYPPYSRLILLLVQHPKADRAESLIRELARSLAAHPLARGVRVSGPAPAPLERLRGKWRWQLLVRASSGSRLRRLVREVVGEPPMPELTIDVDPYHLL
jgi:primosomal protein N' (replication factor Y)